MPSKIILFTLFVLSSAFSIAKAQNSSVSALCISQKEVLNANAALAAAAPSLECTIEKGKDSCTVDFEPISDNYRNACYDAGGKFYVVDLLWDCSVIFGVSYNADFTYLNYPSCTGLNCTADELENLFESSAYELAEQDLLGRGHTCNLSDKNEMFVADSGAGASSNFSICGILGVFALLMVVLHP